MHVLYKIAGGFLFFFLFSTSAYAADSFQVTEFNEYQTYQLEHGKSFEETASSISTSISNSFSVIFDIGFKLFSIIFVVAVLTMAGAITVKNGQWMKWSTSAMIMTLVVILVLRVGPILFLTIDIVGFTLLLTSIVQLIVQALFYIAFSMVLISLFLKMLYRMFEHPKYFKWSRSLMTGSMIIIVLSVVMPFVIDNL